MRNIHVLFLSIYDDENVDDIPSKYKLCLKTASLLCRRNRMCRCMPSLFVASL